MTLQFPACRQLFVLLTLAAFAMSIAPNAIPVAKADAAQSAAAPFAGKFSGDNLTLELSESGGAYVGTITQGDKQFPAKANVTGRGLAGTFLASGDEFTFTATLADAGLILVSGGKAHSLARMVLPAGGAAIDGSQSFGDFTVLGATPTGRTLYIKLPNAQTLESALTQTADELGRVFDAKPVLSGAFADAKARNKGGVSLTARLKGKDIHGVIFCAAGPNGASATVIFATPNASQADLATLLISMPAPPIKMTTHKFPDGSGSIDLADGWTTPDESAAHGIGVTGPEGQRVIWHAMVSISEPDCGTVKMGRQTYQIQLQNYQFSLRQYRNLEALHQRNPNSPVGRPPIPPVEPDPDPNIAYPRMNFCRKCDGAEEVLKYWFPIREEKQKRAGKGYSEVDKIFAVFPAEPNPYVANSKSGVAYLAATDHKGDEAVHIRVVVKITTLPVLEGESWQYCASTMRAPDATFDRDLPVMSAIMDSVNLDMDVVNKKIEGDAGAVRKIYADKFAIMVKAGQDFQDQQAASFAQHEEQIAAQAKARHDSNSDFIEYIGGVRHVCDTRTGKILDVDLFHSDAITDGLNALAHDPKAYVQIPLRYER